MSAICRLVSRSFSNRTFSVSELSGVFCIPSSSSTSTNEKTFPSQLPLSPSKTNLYFSLPPHKFPNPHPHTHFHPAKKKYIYINKKHFSPTNQAPPVQAEARSAQNTNNHDVIGSPRHDWLRKETSMPDSLGVKYDTRNSECVCVLLSRFHFIPTLLHSTPLQQHRIDNL